MDLKSYTRYLIIGLLFILSGCKKESKTNFDIKDYSEITIKSVNGIYLCADRHQNNQIIANRKSAGEWERYSIETLEENKVAIRASNYSYVGSSQGNEGVLIAKYPKIQNNTIFKIIQDDSARLIFQDYQNRYVSIDENGLLRANRKNIQNADLFFLNTVDKKKFSHFSFSQLLPLIIGLILLFVSLITFQYKEDKKVSLILLLLGGFCVRLFVALLNSHLSLWDEQFHALVAKNMMSNPFAPMLYKNPVLPFDSTSWVGGHIWLHKQPLFLWQMALSMKIFGVNILGLRLPSVIMSTIVIFFIYRLGKISVNSTVGFFAALFFALANFTLEITAGAIHTDHNDIAFLFYVCASVWAWVEFENSDSSKKKYFLILVGIFSGCAVLVKWLTGLLVFSGWGLSILLSKERRGQWKQYFYLIMSFTIAIIVFLPWQIYILNTFPIISRHEFALNTQHFFEVIEEHGGDFWWHFNIAEDIYGVSKYFLLFSIVILIVSIKNKVFKIAFLSYIIIIQLFFAISATKMIAFTYCISFLIFLSIGVVIERFFKIVILNPKYMQKKTHHIIYTTVVIGILLGINLDIEKIQENHTMWKKDENTYLYEKLNSTPVIKSLSDRINNIEDHVIFNCKPSDNIPVMFFNDVVAAYNHIPDYETCLELKEKGYKIAVFNDNNLPSYLLTDEDITKISEYY